MVVERSCGALIPRVLPTSLATERSIDLRRKGLKSRPQVSDCWRASTAPLYGSSRLLCGGFPLPDFAGTSIVGTTVRDADPIAFERAWYDSPEICLQPGSPLRGASTGLIHGYAYLFGTASCSGRPLAGGDGLLDFRGHVGSDLCTIVNANIPRISLPSNSVTKGGPRSRGSRGKEGRSGSIKLPLRPRCWFTLRCARRGKPLGVCPLSSLWAPSPSPGSSWCCQRRLSRGR